MARHSNREKILTEGLRVVHERGFGGASVRDIVQAAGVPQGSFTNHFASKEAFGLEILDLYFANARQIIDRTLRNDSLPPLQRLRAYLDANKDLLIADDMRKGCLLGNFTIEAGGESETIRRRLAGIFAEIRGSIAYCLEAAAAAGELPADFACGETACFILSSLQGAILLSKAEHDPAPVERFEAMLFSKILR
jgi:TetR/AcrR family transcriptional repressor of nem operon